MADQKPADLLASLGSGGEWFDTRPGEHCCIRVAAADTNGVYSLVEIVSDPGDGTPLHLHQNEDEHLIVLEGTARLACGDKVFDAQAGSVVALPKNVPHAWGNRSDKPLRIAVIAYPGGVEEALRAIARGGKDMDLPGLARSLGVNPLGPAPF
jgi:quercetin dioxygenase-like cupin family protein